MSTVDAREGSRVETLRLDAVALDPRNARAHPARNVAAVASSLAQLGAGRSIVLDRDNRVVAGNCTVEQARAAGFDRLLVVEPQPGELVAVRRPDWTPAEATAYGLVDNRSAEFAEWHPENLALAIEQVKLECPEVVLDFKPVELAAIMPKLEVEEDEAPEPQAEVFAQRGDVITLGRHRVMCGDSTSAEDVAALLGGDKPSLCLTDPPYGCRYRLASWKDDPEHNFKLVEAAFALAPQARVWTPGKMNLLRELTRDPSAKVLAWTKAFSPAGSGLGGASIWEPVLVLNPPVKMLKTDHLAHRTYQDKEVIGQHPDPKPVTLWAELLAAFCGDDVYDPFLGSGTTLIAADQLGRRCFGMEICEAYADVVVRRWLAHCAKTGRAPEVTGWRGSE